MNPPPDPEDGSQPTAEWIGFALNVGLKLAETFGLGLTLFNALRARFSDVSGAILGDITSTIGQAVRVATGLTTSELNQALPLGDLPTVPASWHEGAPGDRVVVGVDVQGQVTAGEDAPTHRVWVNGTEYDSAQELIDAAEALYVSAMEEYDPIVAANMANQVSQLIFAARRF